MLPKRRNLNSAEASAIFFYSCRVVPQSPAAEPHVGGRHTYDGVLPCTPKGSFATLLSPPQCHADFGTMPHTLASVDQSLLCCPVRDEDAKRWIFLGEGGGRIIPNGSSINGVAGMGWIYLVQF
jgi:hypothetical protein